MTATMAETTTVYSRHGVTVTVLYGLSPTVSIHDSRTGRVGLFSPDEARQLGLRVSSEGFGVARASGDESRAVRLAHLGAAILYGAELVDTSTVGVDVLARSLAQLAEAEAAQ